MYKVTIEVPVKPFTGFVDFGDGLIEFPSKEVEILMLVDKEETTKSDGDDHDHFNFVFNGGCNSCDPDDESCAWKALNR